MTDNLKIGSYNCRGHAKDRIDYIQKLMKECDVLFLQEHWYLESNLSCLENQLSGVSVFGISGVHERKIPIGRPYGGCAIVYNNSLNVSMKPIDSDSKRLCACTATLPNGIQILMCNVYMPCDTGSNIDDNKEVLAVVQSIIDTHSGVDFFIVGGVGTLILPEVNR